MTTSNQQLAQKPKFSVMITTQSYQNLINNTLPAALPPASRARLL